MSFSERTSEDAPSEAYQRMVLRVAGRKMLLRTKKTVEQMQELINEAELYLSDQGSRSVQNADQLLRALLNAVDDQRRLRAYYQATYDELHLTKEKLKRQEQQLRQFARETKSTEFFSAQQLSEEGAQEKTDSTLPSNKAQKSRSRTQTAPKLSKKDRVAKTDPILRTLGEEPRLFDLFEHKGKNVSLLSQKSHAETKKKRATRRKDDPFTSTVKRLPKLEMSLLDYWKKVQGENAFEEMPEESAELREKSDK